MGCCSSKTAPAGASRKTALLIQARYSLPLWILVKANDMKDEKVNEFKEAFKKTDKSNTGAITVKEVSALMKSTKHIQSDKEIQTVIAKAGVGANEKVDFDLFLKMVLGYTRRADPEVEMKEAFAVFDSNKDGVINSEEMRSVFSNLGNRLTDAELAALIRDADIDGDGLVDYNEFIRLLCNPNPDEQF